MLVMFLKTVFACTATICTKIAHMVFSVGIDLFLTFVIMLGPITEAVENTTPGSTISVNGGDNVTLVCTYTEINPDNTFKVRFMRKVGSRYKDLWVYEGNSTYATSDGPTPDYAYLNMQRVNKGSEQFNISLQFSNVTLDVQYGWYYCVIVQQTFDISGQIQINVESGNLF